jgi:hypothetical protein
MTKIGYVAKELFYMMRKYRLYILLPLFLMLLLLVLVVFYVGPAVVISFIYAGV